MLHGLVRLIRHMDSLNSPAELRVIGQLLLDARIDRSDLAEACKFNSAAYSRTVFSQSPWYQLIVICWRSGQSSPIHDHRGSRCGVRVVEGIATEVMYERTTLDRVVPVRESEYCRDDICTSSDTEIHSISNRQLEADLITMHLYSPPLRMSVYDLDERVDSDQFPAWR